jgi:hypothetical protein
MSVADYLAKMQGLANNMSTTRKPLDDEDLVQYILAGLDEDYDYIVNPLFWLDLRQSRQVNSPHRCSSLKLV